MICQQGYPSLLQLPSGVAGTRLREYSNEQWNPVLHGLVTEAEIPESWQMNRLIPLPFLGTGGE